MGSFRPHAQEHKKTAVFFFLYHERRCMLFNVTMHMQAFLCGFVRSTKKMPQTSVWREGYQCFLCAKLHLNVHKRTCKFIPLARINDNAAK